MSFVIGSQFCLETFRLTLGALHAHLISVYNPTLKLMTLTEDPYSSSIPRAFTLDLVFLASCRSIINSIMAFFFLGWEVLANIYTRGLKSSIKWRKLYRNKQKYIKPWPHSERGGGAPVSTAFWYSENAIHRGWQGFQRVKGRVKHAGKRKILKTVIQRNFNICWKGSCIL